MAGVGATVGANYEAWLEKLMIGVAKSLDSLVHPDRKVTPSPSGKRRVMRIEINRDRSGSGSW